MCLCTFINSLKSLFGSGIESFFKFIKGVKIRNIGRDFCWGYLEFRGIFGLGFFFVLIVYKSFLMLSKE